MCVGGGGHRLSRRRHAHALAHPAAPTQTARACAKLSFFVSTSLGSILGNKLFRLLADEGRQHRECWCAALRQVLARGHSTSAGVAIAHRRTHTPVLDGVAELEGR